MSNWEIMGFSGVEDGIEIILDILLFVDVIWYAHIIVLFVFLVPSAKMFSDVLWLSVLLFVFVFLV